MHFMISLVVCVIIFTHTYAQSYNTTIMVVLGCHIKEVQTDRFETALNYNKSTDIWFLTGGTKHALDNHVKSEADVMNELDKPGCLNMNVVLDRKAKNTAENFAYLKKWLLKKNLINNSNIVITTSEFHKNRAELLFKQIIPEIEPVWNLGIYQCKYCKQDEALYIRNVNSDVEKALKLL